MKNYDIIIIGAGIVGLATALKLLEKDSSLKILILEKENEIAKHQTGNNSGVIHSGIYYKPGSLKAKNCKQGYDLLINFCNEQNVKYEICGKIILATSEKEIPIMHNIYERGIQNGLTDLKLLNENEINEIEPYAKGISAIYVPQTGIIDYKEVSNKYLSVIKKYNGEILFNEEVIDLKIENGLSKVFTKKNKYISKLVVTCSGLQSDRLAKLTHKKLNYRLIPFRGEYYKLKKDSYHLVKNLIYPVPDPSFPFLGVHFTRMIDNCVECGPNAVLSFKREGYSKSSFSFRDTYDTFSWKGFRIVMKKHWKTGLGEFYRSYNKNAFVGALKKLVPVIEKDNLTKGGAGIRAQACLIDGTLIDDFLFLEDKGVIHVCNAPSPAATASLSIGQTISEKVFAQLN
ncbi:MAG: L-2-hydroxyglutarate oxidase [Melioribacteraceae bacterium]|nr:L-2-hydroxyglutarate oxidase [Melioribacteraceae bacterium]